MLKGCIMIKMLKIILVLWFTVSFINLAYAEADLSRIYGLREKDKLNELIHNVEKQIKIDPSDKITFKILGIAYHNLAVLKVKGASVKAVEYLEKAYSLLPDDHEVLAYFGNAKTMMARDSWNIFTIISEVNKGLDMIDEAVNKAPDNIPIRMVRANNSLNVPGVFDRKEFVKTDFHHIEMLLKDPSWMGYSYIKAEIFYQLGMFYKAEGNEFLAREYFEKAVVNDSSGQGSKWGLKAKKEL
jgi:tetratricopeptide (TPR) repeat protein